MPPEPIWHQECKGVNLAPASTFLSGGPYGPKGKGKLFNADLLLPTFEERTVCFCVKRKHFLWEVFPYLCTMQERLRKEFSAMNSSFERKK